MTSLPNGLEESQLLAGVFQYPRLVLVRGEGSWVWDTAGRKYLDFTAGLAVAALGHGRQDLADTLRDQFATLGHTSNLYGNLPSLELAQRLVQASFATRIWYANSGTEANEAALKFARVAAQAGGNSRQSGILAFKGGFHGRTMGALSATYHPSYRKPFAPLVPGVRFATFNDLESARRQMSTDTAAVIVEPVQGEGGVVPATPEFLRGLRRLCDEHGAMLIFDEVQCGLGRAGALFAYQVYDVVPDMLTLAKPIAGGLPLGAVLLGPRVVPHLKPGQHGSTFSGGPAVCAVGVKVFDAVSAPEFLAQAGVRAGQLRTGLETVAARSTALRGVRGMGLMQALILAPAWKKRGGEVISGARERGLLVTRAGDDAIRLLPPLTCTADEITEAVAILRTVFDALAGRRPARAAAQFSPSPEAGAPAAGTARA